MGYLIYLLIIVFSLIAAFVERRIAKRDKFLVINATRFAIFFYSIIVILRVMAGNGRDYLSFSFIGKTFGGYAKVLILLGLATLLHLVLERFAGELYCSIYNNAITILCLLGVIWTIFVGLPTMGNWSAFALVSLCLSVIAHVINHIKPSQTNKYAKYSLKQRFIGLLIVLSLYAFLFFIEGPTELYFYNASEFVYSYSEVILHMIVGSIAFVIVSALLLSYGLSDFWYIVSVFIIFAFDVCAYCQSMFFNGHLQEIDGSTQKWEGSSTYVNAFIWLVLIAILAMILYKMGQDRGFKAMLITAGIILFIQIFTTITVVALNNNIDKSYQLITDGSLSLSTEDNIVIFILDAYDTQMIEKVVEESPDYLDPLKDFTYYSNMESEYVATDGSLPFLLTGIRDDAKDADGNSLDWYKDSHFLKDIKDYGYDINILTDSKYVEQFDDNLISNYSDEGWCILNPEKTIQAFSKCMRYKCMPYILKPFYKYETYDLTNIIVDSNVYIMGTDAEFDDRLLEEGIDLSEDINAFRIYHLYGAHSPYYLDENGNNDYTRNDPIAQWKGSLKIVYDYIDAMKSAGIYDRSNIIIMADHGLNNSNRSALDDLGIDYNPDKSNPIFFIKKKNQKSDNFRTNINSCSHKQFFDTVMECIDSTWQDRYFVE